MYYPDPDNNTLPAGTTFGVYYLITGFGGFAPPHLYRDYMSRVASHGYVVLGSWPLVTGEGIGDINFTAEAHVNNIEYVSDSSSCSSYLTAKSIWAILHAFILRNEATIHQVTTMLANSKNVPFPGHNHLLTTGIDDTSL